MSNTPTVSVHEIEDLPLRSLFAREDREFTPWLAARSRPCSLGLVRCAPSRTPPFHPRRGRCERSV